MIEFVVAVCISFLGGFLLAKFTTPAPVFQKPYNSEVAAESTHCSHDTRTGCTETICKFTPRGSTAKFGKDHKQ